MTSPALWSSALVLWQCASERPECGRTAGSGNGERSGSHSTSSADACPIFHDNWNDRISLAMTKAEQALAARARVVIVNGPAGVGKTTTARILAALGRSGACVHGDDLKGFIVRRDAPVATGLGYRNGATVAGNFIAGGYDLVVFDYVFESPAGIEVFLGAYTASAPVHLFTLWADLPTVLAREAQRHDTRQPLGDRVRACHAAMERHLDELGEIVDTSHRDARAVAAEVCLRACAGSGLIHPGAKRRSSGRHP